MHANANSDRRTFLPAAGHDLFLPLYDPVVKMLGGERVRREVVGQAAIGAGHRVLDIGCGTGGLALLVKRLHSDAEVVGLDPDSKALRRARRKAERAALAITFDQGFSDELPYPDSSFDVVFSSFMFHHLKPEEKEATLREVRRVLKPGGCFHLLDFSGPDSAEGFLMRLLHSSRHLKDNSERRIIELLRQAGFEDPGKAGQRGTLVGRAVNYRACSPKR